MFQNKIQKRVEFKKSYRGNLFFARLHMIIIIAAARFFLKKRLPNATIYSILYLLFDDAAIIITVQ